MSNDLTLHLGHDELVVRRRYGTLSILNDVLVAAWFIAGSILFFHESTTVTGTWLFLAGSVELLVRPLIRLARNLHVQRRSGDAPGRTADF